jgi:hypothetical protein
MTHITQSFQNSCYIQYYFPIILGAFLCFSKQHGYHWKCVCFDNFWLHLPSVTQAIDKLFDLFLSEPHIIEWSRYRCEKFNVESMPFLFIYVKMVVMHYHTYKGDIWIYSTIITYYVTLPLIEECFDVLGKIKIIGLEGSLQCKLC